MRSGSTPVERLVERPCDGVDDRGLGLAVGVGARLRLGLADEAGVAVHAHEHVVRAAHAARREPRRTPVGQRERDRLDAGDPDGARERLSAASVAGSVLNCTSPVPSLSRHNLGSGDAWSNTNQVSIEYVLNMNGSG